MHRKKGRWQRQPFAITQEIRDQLIAITDNSLKGYRDRALLLFAYDSMRRRNELCACQWTDISTNPDGSGSWFLQFSKPDQEGYGKHIPLTAKTMKALQKRKDKAQLKDGRILRGFLRHQQLATSLNTSHIAKVFKTLAKKANLNEQAKRNISVHSARVRHAHDLLK